MPCRVALVSWESLHSIPVGGLAAHVSGLAQALATLGSEVHVFTRLGAGQSAYDLVGGVHYHRCAFPSHPDFLTYVDRMCDAFVERIRATEDLLGRPFDVVHGHDWLATRALVRAKNELGRPVLLTMHSTEYGRCGNELCGGTSERVREREWEGTYVASRVICVSGALRDEVRWLYQVPADKMCVIYNGVDVARFDEDVDGGRVRADCHVGAEDPLVLFVGRLAWQKGPDLLLDAVPRVLDDHHDAKFAFVGDGEMRGQLEDRAGARHVRDAVRFLGRRGGSDLVGLFRSADTVCVPSRNEPFGIVVLEAWSARRPVVVTRSGGPAEFVRDEETGFTVVPERDAIGQGIERTLDDRCEAEQVGRNGRREAERHFSWDVIAAETLRIYGTLA